MVWHALGTGAKGSEVPPCLLRLDAADFCRSLEMAAENPRELLDAAEHVVSLKGSVNAEESVNEGESVDEGE